MKKPFFLILIALFLIGCGGAPEVKTPANSVSVNTNPANIEETAESKQAKSDILNSTKKLQELKFWSAKIVSAISELNGEMEYLAPDRFRLKKTDGEAIVIGKNSFIYENGKWKKSEEDLSALVNAQKGAMTEAVIKSIKNVQILGKESINGKQTTIYFHKNSQGKFGEVTTKTWIADDTGLVMKSEVETKIGDDVQKVATVYDYEKPVKIEAPKID